MHCSTGNLFFIGVVAKSKTLPDQLITLNGSFSFLVEFVEDAPVSPQNIIDRAHEIVGIAVQSIVVSRSAVVTTKFFIGSSRKGAIAFFTTFTHNDIFFGFAIEFVGRKKCTRRRGGFFISN